MSASDRFSVNLPLEVERFIREDVLDRFQRYVRIHTTSDRDSAEKPSSVRQWDLLRLLQSELAAFGVRDVKLAETGYVSGVVPANCEGAPPFGLMAHVDTSPDQPGDDVRPQLHENWDGNPIRYPDDRNLTLSTEDCAELADFVGDTIITAGGLTLLGADDKAGVAEIMSAVAAFHRFPELRHGEVRVFFTTDEEVGRGVNGIDVSALPPYLYTMDGGYPGELEAECFDAFGVKLTFHGRGVHPGYAYHKMLNAAYLAGLFVHQLPADERPETTRDRQGFYHISRIQGDNERAEIDLIIRDFERANNERRIETLVRLTSRFEEEHPGLKINVAVANQYENMRDTIAKHPHVMELADAAIRDAGVPVVRRAIRGGTDGSRLTAMGYPTPNIFAGGLLFHSRREWIAHSSLVRATATIVHLARRWADSN